MVLVYLERLELLLVVLEEVVALLADLGRVQVIPRAHPPLGAGYNWPDNIN